MVATCSIENSGVHAGIATLYEELFPAVARWVGNRRGTFDEARDVFHDAMVIYLEKCANDDFQPLVSQEAYVMGIVGNLWARRKIHEGKTVPIDDTVSMVDIPADYFPAPDNEKLLEWISATGERCLSLLRDFYSNMPLSLIAQKLGYRNEHSASVQKYKCIEKIRERLKEKSILYEDFLK